MHQAERDVRAVSRSTPHPDHVAVTKIGEDARFDAKLTKSNIPGEPWHPKRIIYYFCTHLRMNFAADVLHRHHRSDRHEDEAASLLYKSQFAGASGEIPEMVKSDHCLLRQAASARNTPSRFSRTKCWDSAGWIRCCSKDDKPSHAVCADLPGSPRCPQTGKIHRASRRARRYSFASTLPTRNRARSRGWNFISAIPRSSPDRENRAQPQDVDDVIQDVLLGFYGQSPTFIYDPSRGRFRGYLKVCTFRALKRRIGQNARFNGVPLDDVDPESPDVEKTWNDAWERESFARAVEQLRREIGLSPRFKAFERHVMDPGISALSCQRSHEALSFCDLIFG